MLLCLPRSCLVHTLCPHCSHPWRDLIHGFQTGIFHLLVNVIMESCGDSTNNTCIRDLLSRRAALTSHYTIPRFGVEMRTAPVKTIIFHLMVHVYMENCGDSTANTLYPWPKGLHLPVTNPTQSEGSVVTLPWRQAPPAPASRKGVG